MFFEFSFLLFFETPLLEIIGREAAGDIKHRQHGKDKCLKKSAEYIKVKREYGGQTYLQERNRAEHSREPAQEHSRKFLQEISHEYGYDRARQHISEVTECHGYRRCHLADDIERGERNRVGKAAEIMQKTAFHFIMRYQHEYENRPAADDIQIRSRRIKPDERQQAGKCRYSHDSRYKRSEI